MYKTRKQTLYTINSHVKRFAFDGATPAEPSRVRNTFIHGPTNNTGTTETKFHHLGEVHKIAASHSKAIPQILHTSCLVEGSFPCFLGDGFIEILLVEPLSAEFIIDSISVEESHPPLVTLCLFVF